MKNPGDRDIIAAVATPPGRGGVGIVRVSGRGLAAFVRPLITRKLVPRTAHFSDFVAGDKQVIDQGIVLFFPAPHSFTGEDVVEFHGHGGPVVMDQLLDRVLELGARLARPGEFSERAFLNDKIDLAQAEAIADLIDASSRQAARSALRSLQGEFSRRVRHLVESLVQLRIYIEAAIDFPEEEIDFMADDRIKNDLLKLQSQLKELLAEATQGTLLQEGMSVVIAGRPNAGKSSLLNALSGRDAAIVTDVAGTTRDVLRERIHIDGMPLHIVDTAGLRSSGDAVETEGIRRAWAEIDKADRILLVLDSTVDQEFHPVNFWPELFARIRERKNITLVMNKIDLAGFSPTVTHGHFPCVRLSAKTGQGIHLLREHLKNCMGFQGTVEGSFTARRRHLEALERAGVFLESARMQLEQRGGELVAEDLRMAQQAVSEITGEFTPDDLLGRIFSSFCIGK